MIGVDECPRLDVEQLRVAYVGADATTLTIVAGLSFTAAPGTMVCLSGRSGSGKTSVLRRLSGLARSDGGGVRWDGTDLAQWSADECAAFRRTRVGYLDQEAAMLDELSCLDNVLLPAVPDGRRELRAARRRAVSVLGQLGLGDRLRWRPAQMSGGERQRAALARVLVSRTPGILADEPTASLDRAWASNVIRTLREHASRGGLVIAASHDQAVAAASDLVIELD